MTASTVRDEPETLGVRLRESRMGKRLSLRAACAGIDGISPSTLCRVENGERQLVQGPALTQLAARVGLPEDEAVDLAGGLSPQGVLELLGADLSLAVRGGRLTAAGRTALRNAHLDELANRQQAVEISTLADSLDLDFRPTDEPPGFDSRETYRIPRHPASDLARAWKAHGVAHVLMWTGPPALLECRALERLGPATPAGRAEQEATRLARKLLVPAAKLHAAARRIHARDFATPEELADMTKVLAARLDVPADLLTARLVEENIIGGKP